MSAISKRQIIAYIETLPPSVLGVEKIGDIKICDLPQGVWNFNYLVQIGSQKFVFKVYQPWAITESMFTTNSGWREFESLKLVEPLDIAPKPILFDDAGSMSGRSVLIYEYAEGSMITYSERAAAELAKIYSKLHGLDVSRTTFLERRDETITTLMANIEKKYAHYAGRDDVSALLKRRFEAYIDRTKGRIANKEIETCPQAIIHADPVAGNIVVGPKVVLIDWQTVMIGDPAFDIWACTADAFTLWDTNKPPSASQEALLRQTYLSLRDDPDLEERIAIKEPLYLLEYGLHCSTRYYDYKSNKMPSEAVAGREANFEKYGMITDVILDSLGRVLD
jgi:aminoglycoside phosphotransferase (APT) family kinase protein